MAGITSGNLGADRQTTRYLDKFYRDVPFSKAVYYTKNGEIFPIQADLAVEDRIQADNRITVRTLNQLIGIRSHLLFDEQQFFVQDLNQEFRWDQTATSGDYEPTDKTSPGVAPGYFVAVGGAGGGGAADGTTYFAIRLSNARGVAPTVGEVSSPVNGDVAIVRLANGYEERWKRNAGSWALQQGVVPVQGVFDSLPSLAEWNLGEYVWLVEQADQSDNGLYEKVRVNPIGPVDSWVQRISSGGGGSTGSADGTIYYVARATNTRNVAPTVIEVPLPVSGDSAVVVLGNGVEERWKHNGTTWSRSQLELPVKGVFTTVPPLTDWDVGEYIWLVEQVDIEDNGLYEKVLVNPIGPVYAWTQRFGVTTGGGGGGVGVWAQETFILSALDIANGYVTITGSPTDQEQIFFWNETIESMISPGTGFTYNAGLHRVTWDVVRWGSAFQTGDEISIRYLT